MWKSLVIITIAFAVVSSGLPDAPFEGVLPRAIDTTNFSSCPYNASQPEYCKGINSTSTQYLCGEYLLGPKELPPANTTVGAMMLQYDRLHGLCPLQFIERWAAWNSGKMRWQYTYPGYNGSQLDEKGDPIRGFQLLLPGMLLDRFGAPETGHFVSPAFSPYIQRAIPPSNLNAPANDSAHPYQYHVYEVVRNFTVISGPIAPWFGQPGQGTQYEILEDKTVWNLTHEGFLKEWNKNQF